MIRLEQILSPARSRVNVPGGSKKKVLELIAQLFADDQPGLSAQLLFDSLIAREKLGSTGFGNGIAIPHCRLADCKQPVGAVVHLENPVDFDAIDGAPVDLLFVLLVPAAATEDHLALLRQAAALFEQEQSRELLRKAADNHSLYQAVLDRLGAAGAC